MKMHMTGLPLRWLIASVALCLGADEASDPQRLGPIEQGVGDVGPLSESLRVLNPDLQQPVDFAGVYHLPGRPDWLMRASGGLYAVFQRSVYLRSDAGGVPIIPNDTVFYIGRASLAGVPGPQAEPATFEEPKAVRLETRWEPRYGDGGLYSRPLAVEESSPLAERASDTTGADRSSRSLHATPRSDPAGHPTRFSSGGRLPHTASGMTWATVSQGLAVRTIEGDPEYRAARVRTLMERALRAERARNATGS
ncbi:MAG: hypothetical protein JSV91_10695 [Phycisphaerales bacterium]|nr:MAG: hypothetical protein JSV91_10695 [Phycisphaerales bacterium]